MATVLVVDDSLFIRRNLKTLLLQAGHTVVAEASNGEEAFEKYIKSKPDLVTMDITMQGISGIDAIARIMALYPDARIVVVSALNERNMVFEALERGAKNYVFKPIYGEKFIAVINDVLNS